MVLPPKFEFRQSQTGPSHRDGSSRSAELEQSMQATRLLGDHERVDSRRGDLNEAISIAPGLQEFFVSSPPALALAQQFQRQRGEFIAVHDIGCQWSRKLLTGIATASGRAMGQLDIRQEGSGVILARLDYVECPTNDGSSLRLYTTDIAPPPGADSVAASSSRDQIALTLLAYARLGVAIVGDMSVSAMRAALAPLNASMQQGPWPSRQLLLLPLTSAGALASLGSEFSEDTGVTVRSTPQVSRTGDAWAFVSGTWNRLRDELMRRELGYGGQSITLPALPGARRSNGPTEPAPARPGRAAEPTAVATPATAVDHPQPRPGDDSATNIAALQRFVERVGQLSGLIACTVFARAHHGERGGTAPEPIAYSAPLGLMPAQAAPDGRAMVAEGLALLTRLEQSSAALGDDSAFCDAIFSTRRGHIMLRRVAYHTDVMFIALFAHTDKPMLYDLQLRRLETDLMPPRTVT